MLEPEKQKRVQVLLLEDSALDAELATARLEKSGLALDVFPAHDRATYLEQLHARKYDLILADYALPDFDGFTALAAAHAHDPSLPFIFISGRVGEEVAIESLQRGATDYVLKQRLERLVPAVSRALKEAEEHAARMRVERRFHDSEMRFVHVIDALPQMVWITTAEGELTYANKAWRDRVPPETASWLDPLLIHPEDRAVGLALWERALVTREEFSCECRMCNREDNAYRWHLVRVVPLLGADNKDGDPCVDWLGTATDTQEQKLNEQALRTAETLAVTGRMLASIAHEINNPLESLTNLIFLTRLEAKGNPRALAYLDMTENELTRISSITKQTLQFYRDPVTPISIDARSICEDVLRLFSTRIATKGFRLKVEVDEEITFKAIKGEIRQVLINLVGNAIDAVQKNGQIQVFVRRRADKSRSCVEFEIRDNGEGIAEDKVHRLFQPFFSTKGAHGTGLGLWVSKGIVEKHGGTITLVSQRSSGGNTTIATVLLPVEPSGELVPDAAASSERSVPMRQQ